MDETIPVVPITAAGGTWQGEGFEAPTFSAARVLLRRLGAQSGNAAADLRLIIPGGEYLFVATTATITGSQVQGTFTTSDFQPDLGGLTADFAVQEVTGGVGFAVCLPEQAAFDEVVSGSGTLRVTLPQQREVGQTLTVVIQGLRLQSGRTISGTYTAPIVATCELAEHPCSE